MTAETPPGGALIVFAREPVPGQVKTRLIPALGAAGTTRLYRHLLDIALRAAGATPAASRRLWCAGAPPAGGHCARLAHQHGLTWRHQPAGDLGARMAAALTATLAESDRAVLIGSDCPDYSPDYLTAAWTNLMLTWIDRLPLFLFVVIALTLGLAPFVPEPHLWEKLKLLAAGNLIRPIDLFDLLLHGLPWVLLLVKLGRLAGRRRA